MTDPTSPLSAERVLKLAAQSMFDTFAKTAMGTMVVDREHRIVWISEGYKGFLPALGFASERDFVGRRVEDVIPNTMLGQVIETGRPILVDLLSNHAGTFLVSRLPLFDEEGRVIGAFGMVLLDHPETTMQPLMQKFVRLQGELDSARRQLAEQRRPKYTIASFVGSSAAALEVKRQARRVAQTDSTVLLLGETGTGKELLAHAIHAASRRSARPFVGVNIAAVPESLLEAEFFGVAPGAYTGAERKGREGKFRVANGGTLFLDEIGDMPLVLQSKLLRVLQEQEIEPLGADRVERVDVRIVAATSRDLAAMVAAGIFRADLYYRLNVLPIRLPPLRDRRDDIEALVEALAEDIARRSGLPAKAVTADALEGLAAEPWPGNIRELRNVLEQATLMTDDMQLTPAHMATALRTAGVAEQRLEAAASAPASALPPSQPMQPTQPRADAAAAAGPLPGGRVLRPLQQQVEEVEREAIAAALAVSAGNRVAAARLLGMSRAALYDKLARHPELASIGR